MGNYELKRTFCQTYKKANTVECVTELACSLNEILSLGAKANLISCEKQEGGISYKARVIFNVVYLLEGEIRRKEFGIELVDFYKLDCENVDKFKVDLLVENVTAKKGEKLCLESIVNAVILAETTKCDNLLVDKENCLVRQREESICELKSRAENVFVIDDEMQLDKELKNVLYSGAVAQITSCQCGLGTIICDGEIVLSLGLLPNVEKSDIIKENRIIPFRLELEENSVSINDLSSAKVCVNDLSIKVVVDEERGKTTLSSQIEIKIFARAYKTNMVLFADDMFSVDKELSLTKENLQTKSFIKQKSQVEKIGGKAFCIPPENSRILCIMEERVYAVNYKVEKDKVVLEGVASGYITFEELNSGAICSKLAEMPFSLEFPCSDLVEELVASCRNLQAKIRNDEIELEGEIIITYNNYKSDFIQAITSVQEGEAISVDNSAFKIYCAQKGDTIWDIAKTLKVSEQEILEQNQLNFPLSGEEKIIIYKALNN